MKKYLLIFLGSVLVGSLSFIPIEKPKPFAMVELFTAEGCSSCPPADVLLQEMTDIFRKEGKEVIGLSFHVTYFNKKGWEDPYSQEIFTERQKKYVQLISPGQLYTPQAIVNGVKEFIGSNPVAFRDDVIEATSKTPSVEIVASAKMEKDSVIVEYKSNKIQNNTVLNIGIVETNVKHFIPRGENKNLTLKHFNIVRSFSTSTLKLNDHLVLLWPHDLTMGNSSIVLFAQNSRSLKIVGATQIAVNQ